MRRPLGATLLSAGDSAAADTVASAIAAHSIISISCHSIHSALVMMRG
jgi:hypothetical protein